MSEVQARRWRKTRDIALGVCVVWLVVQNAILLGIAGRHGFSPVRGVVHTLLHVARHAPAAGLPGAVLATWAVVVLPIVLRTGNRPNGGRS